MGRVRRRIAAAEGAARAARADDRMGATCALCGRALGVRIEWHHAVPKSEGGTDTVPVHPLCHRAIHAALTNAEIARYRGDMGAIAAVPAIARFIAWVADKPPDFHAPTRRARRSIRQDL